MKPTKEGAGYVSPKSSRQVNATPLEQQPSPSISTSLASINPTALDDNTTHENEPVCTMTTQTSELEMVVIKDSHEGLETTLAYLDSKPLPPLPHESNLDNLSFPAQSTLAHDTHNSDRSTRGPDFHDGHGATANSTLSSDQASILTSAASITSVRAAAELLTEYVTATAHSTVDFLAANATVATRNASSTVQYLSSQLQMPRLFNGTPTDEQTRASAGHQHVRTSQTPQALKAAHGGQRYKERELRHMTRAQSTFSVEEIGPEPTPLQQRPVLRSQSVPMLMGSAPVTHSKHGDIASLRGMSSSDLQLPKPPNAGPSRTRTMLKPSAHTAPSIAAASSRSSIAGSSTGASTRSMMPKRPKRRPLQKIPGPEGLDLNVRRELEAQDFTALRLRDGTEGDSWRNWWDPRRLRKRA
ncbi:hypothetical protein BGZ94_002460 [Podila epigama]|nr:hypothetical protein BGZ94_002460 [Podila epigama]